MEKKNLPRVEPLGRVPVSFVKVYDSKLILKASSKNGGDCPELFVDLERPRPEFEQQDGLELHLGVSANFRHEPRHDSAVKPHVDVYLSKSKVREFWELLTLALIRLERGGL